MNIKIILLSSIIFGMITAAFEVFFEKKVEETVMEYTKDNLLSNVISSSLASAIAIVVYSYIDEYFNTNPTRRPIFDSIGVIIGGILVYYISKPFRARIRQYYY